MYLLLHMNMSACDAHLHDAVVLCEHAYRDSVLRLVADAERRIHNQGVGVTAVRRLDHLDQESCTVERVVRDGIGNLAHRPWGRSAM